MQGVMSSAMASLGDIGFKYIFRYLRNQPSGIRRVPSFKQRGMASFKEALSEYHMKYLVSNKISNIPASPSQ